MLKEDRPAKATFYYSVGDDPMLNLVGDLNFRAAPLTEKGKRYRAIVDKADFIVRFHDQGTEQPGTSASVAKPFSTTPEPVNTHDRLKKILLKKKNQLPKDSRGIVVLEVSELFMLSDFSVESALYGDLVAHFPAMKAPSEENRRAYGNEK